MMTLREIGLGTSLLGCLFLQAAATSAQDTSGEGRDRSLAHAPPVEKLDLLFVVDNSNSMAGEQGALRRQLPSLIDALTTGRRYPGDPAPFRPLKDLHVGVVSTDMGIPGVELPPSCQADGGDDGRLRHQPNPEVAAVTCSADYPQYQSYDARYDDSREVGEAAACTASMGLNGCGIEQPLEAALKALWPKKDGAYRFISTTEQGTWGRGDVPEAEGGNLGFLRDDSMIAIVVLSDEEDCSVGSTEHLKPNNQLAEDSPYRLEDINLRCHNHPEFEYDVKNRYLDGLRALRPGREDLVFFSVIAGVPPDLVSSDMIARVAFDDSGSREAFYDAIMNDPRMQEEVDPSTAPGSGQGNLKPSCVWAVPGEQQPSTAFPPRRMVALAREFGEQGIVQSICQDDFAPVLGAIVDRLAAHRHR